MRLFDCHTHLDEYSTEEIHSILERAGHVGVAGAIIAGTTLASSRRCVDLAEADSRLFAGVGIHPMDINTSVDDSTWQVLHDLAHNPRVVAISEVGLDGIGGAPDYDLQEYVFRSQIQIARELRLPIIYHARDAYPRILDVLQEESGWEVGGVAHYFQGDVRTAWRCVDLGFLISMARPLLRLSELQKVAREVPLEYIVLETDAYPQPFKRRRESWTEPRHLMEVAQSVADCKDISVERVIEETGQNLIRVLGKRGYPVKALLQ